MGIGLGYVIFPRGQFIKSLYQRSFLVSILFIALYHLVVYHLAGINLQDIYGIRSTDEISYHEAGIIRKDHLLNPGIYTEIGWTFAWQYVIAINYFLFGINTFLPKIFNSMVFAISSVAFFQLTHYLTNNVKISKRAYSLFIFFLPLLYCNATILRETFLSFLTIMILYTVTISSQELKSVKWYVLLMLYGFLLALTRLEYGIIIFGLVLIYYITHGNFKVWHKILFISATGAIVLLLNTSSFVQQSQVLDTFSGEGRTRVIRSSGTEGQKVQGSYIEYLKVFAKNPLQYSKVILYGFISFFLLPLPHSWLTNPEFLNRQYVASIYNMFFYLLLPCIYFGIRIKIIAKDMKLFDKIIISLVVAVIIAIALNLRDPLRYSIPVAFFSLIYASYGLHYFKNWKKYIVPYTAIFAIILVFIKYVLNIKELFL